MAVFVFKIRNIVYLFIVLKIKYYIPIPYLKSESNITNRKLDIVCSMMKLRKFTK